jgi:hypothetical protein
MKWKAPLKRMPSKLAAGSGGSPVFRSRSMKVTRAWGYSFARAMARKSVDLSTQVIWQGLGGELGQTPSAEAGAAGQVEETVSAGGQLPHAEHATELVQRVLQVRPPCLFVLLVEADGGMRGAEKGQIVAEELLVRRAYLLCVAFAEPRLHLVGSGGIPCSAHGRARQRRPRYGGAEDLQAGVLLQLHHALGGQDAQQVSYLLLTLGPEIHGADDVVKRLEGTERVDEP